MQIGFSRARQHSNTGQAREGPKGRDRKQPMLSMGGTGAVQPVQKVTGAFHNAVRSAEV